MGMNLLSVVCRPQVHKINFKPSNCLNIFLICCKSVLLDFSSFLFIVLKSYRRMVPAISGSLSTGWIIVRVGKNHSGPNVKIYVKILSDYHLPFQHAQASNTFFHKSLFFVSDLSARIMFGTLTRPTFSYFFLLSIFLLVLQDRSDLSVISLHSFLL